MNALCYKIVFSKRLGALVAVGEHTAGQGKTAGTGVRSAVFPNSAVASSTHGFVGALKNVFALATLSCLTANAVYAAPAANTLPTGHSVNSGNVTVSTAGANMTIQQSTDKASVNWQSFSIGSAASVNIQQNSASSVLLNRVVGNDPSQIFGKLTANGQVILINPNGIVFGKGGSVTASAFTASTFGMSEEDFKKGKQKYDRNGSTAGITVEEGASINTTALGGYVALIGSTIKNQGAINTKQGAVVIAAAESVVLPSALTDSVGVPLSGKVRLVLPPSTINTSIENSGTITTEGGKVFMQTAALADAVASVTHTGVIDTSGAQGGAVTLLAEKGHIKVSGSITTNSTDASNKGGDIIIGRDDVSGNLSASTDVSGAHFESKGGFVETSGEHLDFNDVQVKAKDWLLDPFNVTIDAASALTIGNNLGSTNVTIETTSGASLGINAAGVGDITINAAITKTTGTNTTLTLNAANNIHVNADISSSSNALTTTLKAGGNTIDGTGGINTNGGLLTLDVGTTGSSTNLSGVISGSGGLTKLGAGTVTLSGANSYSGTTTVNAGTLGFVRSDSQGAVNLNGAFVNNGTVNFVANSNQPGPGQIGALFINGLVTGSGSWVVDSTTSTASDGSALSLFSNRLALTNAANNFNGAFTVKNRGALWVESDPNSTHSVNLNGANTTLTLWSGNSVVTHGMGALSGSGTVRAGGGTATTTSLQIGNGGGDAIFSGTISGTTPSGANPVTLSLLKAGAGTQILTGTNSYGGSTTVKGGTLQIGNGAAARSTLASGAVILDGASSTLKFANDQAVTLAQTISGNGQVLSDADLTLNGKVIISKSATDGNANLAITTASTNSTAGNITLGAAIVKSDANNDTLHVSSANGITLNAAIGNKTTDGSNASGSLGVTMNAQGSASSSVGLTLNKVIDANGGTVSLTGATTSATTNGITFAAGSGITADSYAVTGTNTSTTGGSSGSAQAAGVLFAGTNSFTSTSTSVASAITGDSRNNNGFAVMFYPGEATLDAGGGALKIQEANTSTRGIRSGWGGSSVINTKGNVTFGSKVNNSANTYIQGTINVQSGSLTVLGKSSVSSGVELWDGGGQKPKILATNGASITVDGESSSAGSFGVILAVANQAIISSDTGAISISGTSSAGTGIYTQNNTSISSSNGGNITLTGTSTGGGGVGLNLTNGSVSTSGQVQLNGSAVTNTGVINAATVSGGVVTVVGSASGTGASAGGVSNSGIITATAGNVHITGTASVGTASGIFSSGAIASNTGDVTLSGSSALSSGVAIQAVVTAQNNVNISGTSSDTASTSQGVVIQNAVKATSGDITVTGNTNSNVQRAIAITANGANNGSLQTVASGKNININADTLLINTPSSVDSGAAGTVTLKTTTNGGAISLGGADTMSSTASSRVLGIDQGELGTIKAAKLVIGDTTTGGNITVGANVTTADATGNVYLKTAGNVSIANNLTVGSTGGKSLSIEASGANSTISGSGIVTANELKINAANATVAMASAANQVNTISANAKSLAFQNGKALSVGTVFSGSADQQSGITTSGATSLSGATNSTVTQTAAINADGLELLGSADFTLNNASNAINSLAANAKSVALTNSKSFSIDTVNSTQGVTTTGTTTLTTTSGDLTLKKNITATGSTVSIDVAGAITREAGTIGADLLNLKAGTTIGSSAKRIQTSVNKLSLNSSGDQYVTDADSVIVSALTTGTGSIDINTASGASDGMLQVDTVNGIVGVSAKGSVNLVGATSVSNKQGVRVNQNVTSTGGGDISITGTHTGTGAGLNLGVYLTSDVGGGGAGAVNITGSALTSTGIYVTGGKISSSKKISLVGSGVIGVNFTGGTGVASLAGGADFLNTDAIYIKGTGTSISDVLLRTPIQNSSKGGNTTIQGAATAGVWLDTGSSITNDASAGSINITAGNGTSTGGGGITTIKGVTITQHANADVVMTTDGLGSLQPAKIIKDGLGAGNIILAAGKLISKGTSSGGNIAPVATNTITNLGTGVTRIYSGSTSGTTALSVLDSSLTNLYLSQVGANVQNADTNVAFGAQLSPTTPIQVFFREKISTLGSGALEGASLTKTYGDGSTQNSQVTNLFAEMATALKSKNSGSLSIAKNAATLNIDKTVLVDDLVSASLNSAAYSSSGFLNANSSGYSYDTFIGSKYGASLAPNQAAKVFVNQKALSVGGVNLQSKTYDGTDTAFFAGTASIGTVSAGSSTSNDGKIIGGDNVAVSTTVNATYETKNVAGVDANGNNNVTISGVLVKANAAGTDDSKNYTWAKVDGKGSITAKEVSYSGLGVVDKAYDGTTAAVLNGAATTSNVAVGSSLANDQKLIAGDNVVLAGTAVGTYASANVVGTNGNGSNTVAVSGLSLAKADAAGSNDTLNYKLVQRTLSADNTIKPADLVITANDDAKFVTQADSVGYAGVKFTGLGNTGTGFVNGENQSVFTGQLTVTRNNVAVNSAGSYTGALEASGYTSSNYKIKYVKGDYYIVPADQVLVKTASSNITYGADPVYNTTAQYLDSNSNTIVTLARSGVNGNYTFSDGVGGELYVSLAPYLNGFAAPASNSGKLNVGTYDIRDPNAFTNGTSNFSGAPIFAGTLRVDKKDVFLNSISASNKTYDGKNSASVSSDAISGTVGNEKLKVSGAGSFDSKNAGVDKTVTVNDVASLDKLNGDNGGDWSNYNLVTSGQMTTKANIDAKEITLVAGNVSKTYNGSNDYVTQQSDLNTLTNQLVSGDKVTSASISYTDKNAGAGNKTANLNSANIDDGNNGNNYIVTLSGNNTSTITPKALTLTLGNVSKTYDGTTGYTTQQADLDVLSNQLIAGDEVVGASISYLNKDAGTNNKNVNLDSVIVSDGQGGNNYTITRAGNSTSTVLKADLTLTGNRSYDGTTTVAGGTLTAVGVRGESFSINGIGDSSNLDSKNVGTVKLTTLNGLSLGTGNAGADADNYNVISASSSSYTINKADVTVTAQAVTKTYDGTTNATGTGQAGILAGAGAGEAVNSAGTQAFTDKNFGLGNKTVKASGVTIKDAANQDVTGNYNIAYVDHTASTINKADVTVTAQAVTKTYDGTTNATGQGQVGTLAGAGAGEVVNSAGTQAFTDKNAGVGTKTVKASGVTIKDAANQDVTGNYNIAYVDHTASTINKADVILKAGTDVKNYDGTTNSSALVNVVNKAAPDTVVANQSFTDKNPNGVNGSTLQVNVGYRIIDAGGLDMSGNYNVTTQTAKGTINQSSANQTKSDSQSSRPNMLPPPPVLMPDANSMQSRKSFNVVAAQKEITPEVDSEHGCSATNLEACECLPSLVAEVEICLPVNRNIKAAYKKPDGSL